MLLWGIIVLLLTGRGVLLPAVLLILLAMVFRPTDLEGFPFELAFWGFIIFLGKLLG